MNSTAWRPDWRFSSAATRSPSAGFRDAMTRRHGGAVRCSKARAQASPSPEVAPVIRALRDSTGTSAKPASLVFKATEWDKYMKEFSGLEFAF